MTVFIALTGVAAGMAGMAGFWFLFARIAVLQAVAANTGPRHAAATPTWSRRAARAVLQDKAVLEVPLPLILVGPDRSFHHEGNLWLALGLAAAVLLVSMGLTMLAPERPLPKEEAPPLDWAPILRLVAMAAVFTAIILGLGAAVRLLGDPLSAVDFACPCCCQSPASPGSCTLAGSHHGGRIDQRADRRRQPAAQDNPSFTWWVVNRLAFFVGTTNLSTFAIYFLQARLGLDARKLRPGRAADDRHRRVHPPGSHPQRVPGRPLRP